jgi:hypothetical protein
MLRPPSIQSQYDLYWSGDDCFVQLPEGASESDLETYRKHWEVARETGIVPPELMAPGRSLAEATKFVMRPIPGTIGRALFDMYISKRLGFTSLIATAFRLALVDIVNGPVSKVIQAPHEDGNLTALGKMATADAVNTLDAINSNIVTELGLIVWDKAKSLSGK